MGTLLATGSQANFALAAQILAYLAAFSYGIYRRHHLRYWPCLALGIVLDLLTQIFCGATSPGVLPGLLLFPVYCLAATVAGLFARIVADRLLRRFIL